MLLMLFAYQCLIFWLFHFVKRMWKPDSEATTMRSVTSESPNVQPFNFTNIKTKHQRLAINIFNEKMVQKQSIQLQAVSDNTPVYPQGPSIRKHADLKELHIMDFFPATPLIHKPCRDAVRSARVHFWVDVTNKY